MLAYVYKSKKIVSGKSVASRTYRGRYRLANELLIRDVALHTTDRQIAERKLADIIKSEEREQLGIDTPKQQRIAQQELLRTHLESFLSDLRVLGRSEIYIEQVSKRTDRLFRECGWNYLKDINCTRFVQWRSQQSTLGPKTLNEYFNSLNALLNWLLRKGCLEKNPLAGVE